MDTITVGIIGCNGHYGRWLTKKFNHFQLPDINHRVIGSDVGTPLTNEDVVKLANVVVFCLPTATTADIIRGLAPLGQPDQLFMDITGVKAVPVQAMLSSQAEVVGLHPMCAPTVENWRGQKVVFCRGRLREWESWLSDFLDWMQADVVSLDPSQHDRLTSLVQGMVHALTLVMAKTLTSQGVPMDETFSIASPFYRIALSLIGRLLGQSPDTYAQIQFCNPHMPALLREAEEQLHAFRLLVEARDQAKFLDWFTACRAYVGDKHIRDGYDLFDKVIRLLADLSDTHSVILQVVDDRPGLLAQVCTLLVSEGINLTSFHSFRISGQLRFWVGFDRACNLPEVERALVRIRDELGLEAIVAHS